MGWFSQSASPGGNGGAPCPCYPSGDGADHARSWAPIVAITSILKAGLGNQLFQYAAARRLALKHGSPLVLATAWYGDPDAAIRPFRLDRFALIHDAGVSVTEEPWDAIFQSNRKRVFKERTQDFIPAVLDLPAPSVLFGYFAAPAYFEDAAEQLRADLVADCSAEVAGEMARLRSGAPLVSIHVRRGDYVDISPDGALLIPARDIRAAMDRFPAAEFLVFSDDLDWCRRELGAPGVRFSSFGDEVADLTAMSLCDHHILAVSTFSWWGAWLNPSPSKRVLYPAGWYAGRWPGRPEKTGADCLLPGWEPY